MRRLCIQVKYLMLLRNVKEQRIKANAKIQQPATKYTSTSTHSPTHIHTYLETPKFVGMDEFKMIPLSKGERERRIGPSIKYSDVY